jgi:hypothetical protein
VIETLATLGVAVESHAGQPVPATKSN